MLKVIISLVIVLALCMPVISFAESELAGIPDYIASPEDVAAWFSHDFTYQLRLPKYPQTPQETINAKAGECDDFAALASEILKRLGISSSVAAIYFKESSFGHVICIWQGKDGTYNFISNRVIYYTGETTMDGAVKKIYRGVKRIVPDIDRADQARYFKIA